MVRLALIDLQGCITEWEQMGNTGLPSVKNKKLMLQFTQDLWNWTIEDWKEVSWPDESQFLL